VNWRLGLAAAALVIGFATEAAAEVRVVRRPDGSTYVYNVGGSAARPAPGPKAVEAPRRAETVNALVERHANRAALEPELVKAVIQVESAFNAKARSRKGAMGLMQLMPTTAAVYAVSDPYDPEQNVGAGTRYLRHLIDSLGGLELGLAGYNAGPAAVKRFGGVPPYPETRDYVEKVMRLYREEPDYSLAAADAVRPGRKTYLRRDASGRLVMTTTPPGN
jgi:soluble lytic murein transglycosylase-like protein